MKKKSIRFAIFASVAAIMFSSCVTYPVSMSPSSTPVHDKIIGENLGKTEGSDAVYSVLGLWMIGRPDIDSAVKSALAKKNGEALINVRVYETTVWYVLFTRTIVRVEGEAVTFRRTGEKDEKKK